MTKPNPDFISMLDNTYEVRRMLAKYLNTDGKPPEHSTKTVYHYTSLDVLNAMCKEDGDLLCTHFMSLNDNQEFFLGVDTVLKKLTSVFTSSEIAQHGLDQFQKRAPDIIVAGLRNENLSPWITSFSSDPDSLYQWVAYTDRNHGGIAIGFDRELLRKKAVTICSDSTGSPFCQMGWCLYANAAADSDKMSNLIRNAFNIGFQMEGDKHMPDKQRDAILLAAVYICASTIKNRSFAQEKESRLIMLPTKKEALRRYRFVGGKPRIVSEFFGRNHELANAITSVVISPHGDREKLISSVNLLRKHLNLKFPIYLSSSSYNGR